MKRRKNISPQQIAVMLLIRLLPAACFLVATLSVSAQDAQVLRPTIIALGDSITKGVRSGVTKEQTSAAILAREHKQIVLNVGIGGERTDQALKRLHEAVISKRPRFVLIMYGTNDSYIDQ